MTNKTCLSTLVLALVTLALPELVQAQSATSGRVTVDVDFLSHDGFSMRGRLTLPDTLEKQAEAAGKSNMEFFYFADLDHGLGSMTYFQKNILSPGDVAIYDFMRRHALDTR